MEQALISSDSSRSGIMPRVFEKLRADAGHVHQADGLVPVAIDLLACVIIGLQRLFDGSSDLRLLNFDFFQPR